MDLPITPWISSVVNLYIGHAEFFGHLTLQKMLSSDSDETIVDDKKLDCLMENFPLPDLPMELLLAIFSHLDPFSVQNLALSSKLFYQLSTSISARSALLIRYYGKGSCIYSLYTHHKPLLSVDLIQCLIINGGLFPRFLAQIIVQDFQSRTRAVPAIAVYVFSIKYALEKYLEMAELKSNDLRIFERLVRVGRLPSEEATDAIHGIEQLITKYNFFPVAEKSFRLVGESLFLMANLDIRLISLLVSHTGFDLSPYNDKVMDRLFQQVSLTENQVLNYVQVGFQLTDYAIKRALAFGRPQLFEILDSLVESKRLQELVDATVFELFGPYLDKELSLNIPWNSDAISRLINHYHVSPNIIKRALLTHPEESSTFDTVHESFPVTRPYLKSKPYLIWRWILDQYGPHHSFTTACFDDAISRAVSDPALHDLLDYFLGCGVVMRPRHIKILACRVLHRNMTSNALEMMIELGKQLRERYRKTLVQQRFPDLDVDYISLVDHSELLLFKQALNRDMLQNREWKERSRSIQLGSGHNGGAYRIDRAPSDVVQFTEEGTKLMGDLLYWEKQRAKVEQVGKENIPKASAQKENAFSVKIKHTGSEGIYQKFLRSIKTYFSCGDIHL